MTSHFYSSFFLFEILSFGSMEICPVDRSWIHTYVVEPYLKGCELIYLAWKGYDNSLVPAPLSLKERVICWLKGFFLMIPLINTIIWITWQTFGNPEPLNDPFCPEVDPPPPVIIYHSPPPPVTGNAPAERFTYVERVGDSRHQTYCTIQPAADLIIVRQGSDQFSTTSMYRSDFSLKGLHYQFGSKQIDLAQNGNQLHVRSSENGVPFIEQDLECEPLPWIQQRIGFRPFVMSDQTEIFFNAIVPEYPSLVGMIPFLEKPPFVMKMVARKIGQEEVPGFGSLLKIETTSTWRWPYNAIRSELWFDPQTGCLKKFVDSGTFIHRKIGELVQNHP